MPAVAMRSTHRYPIHPQSQRSPFSAVTRTQPFLQLQIGVRKVPSSRGGGEAEWEWRKLGRGLAPRVGAGASALAGPGARGAHWGRPELSEAESADDKNRRELQN